MPDHVNPSASRVLYEMYPFPRALDGIRRAAVPVRRRAPLRARVGLLDDHWSLFSGHWSVDVVSRYASARMEAGTPGPHDREATLMQT